MIDLTLADGMAGELTTEAVAARPLEGSAYQLAWPADWPTLVLLDDPSSGRTLGGRMVRHQVATVGGYRFEVGDYELVTFVNAEDGQPYNYPTILMGQVGIATTDENIERFEEFFASVLARHADLVDWALAPLAERVAVAVTAQVAAEVVLTGPG